MRDVTKIYDRHPVLTGVSLDVDEGEIVCLLGPSGSGKSTLLRIVAGLEAPEEGEVLYRGRPLTGVPVHQRGFGFMFQDYALFPHKDVAANIAFGLRMEGWARSRVEARLAEMLDLVGLEGYGGRRVYELSGGEQQRVALARSLAPGPRLLMLDEPLGSLDRTLREELMNEVRAILKQVARPGSEPAPPRSEPRPGASGITSIYVTHDQQEAFAVADRLAILRAGRIVQRGTPQEVYRHPASPWVARFLGLTNLIPGRVTATDPTRIDTPLGAVTLSSPRSAGAGLHAGVPGPGTAVTVLIRPEAAQVADGEAPDGLSLPATVTNCSFRGSYYRLAVRHRSGIELAFDLISDEGRLPCRGEEIVLALHPDGISLLPVEESDVET
ncbi:MAG: ABC transporter ATP-binding protein [Anaerolineae bacterium]|nr:ABC transporter ATP-binding protein [Anaerolineae bacterium]